MIQSMAIKELMPEGPQTWQLIGLLELNISLSIPLSGKLGQELINQYEKLIDHLRILRLQEVSFTGQPIGLTRGERIRDRSEPTLKGTILRALRKGHQLLDSI